MSTLGEPRTRRISPDTIAAGSLIGPLMDFAAAVVRRHAVDPITTELVRLRCANHHDCHT